MVKKFEEFVNEELSYEEDKNREALANIVRRTIYSRRRAEILLKYFGLYKDENGEYLEPKTAEELGEEYNFLGSRIENIIKKGIQELKNSFVSKRYDDNHTPYDAPAKDNEIKRIHWINSNPIRKKDRQTLYDLLSTITDKDIDISDEDIVDMRKGDIEEMKSLKDALYYEEIIELKKILAKLDKAQPEDFEEEEFGVIVNTKTNTRYRVFLDKDKADDFVTENEEDVLSDVMDYPYKYKSYEKHFYIVMLSPEE